MWYVYIVVIWIITMLIATCLSCRTRTRTVTCGVKVLSGTVRAYRGRCIGESTQSYCAIDLEGGYKIILHDSIADAVYTCEGNLNYECLFSNMNPEHPIVAVSRVFKEDGTLLECIV